MPELTPGARRFLEQRKAQGLDGVTDDQAERLAILMAPVPGPTAKPAGRTKKAAS
jgi:hypothetical protein